MRNLDNKENLIAWFKEVIGLTNQAATALYEEQLFKDKKTIAEFGDSEIDSVCRSLRRDSNISIAELCVTRLKLLTFWIRHQDRTGREVGVTERPLVRTTLVDINLLKEQKRLEDGWASDNKEPDYAAIPLDLNSAAKAFEKVKTILTRIRGVLGVPIVYVIRHLLIPEEADDDPAFGKEGSTYTSHDNEAIARTDILTDEADFDATYELLEVHGPFVPTFLTDSKKVWSILHALFSTSGAWQHVKKYTATQTGRQVYRTLHTHFFGADKINTLYTDILQTLKGLFYSGDRRNFTFDKYCTAHVEQHNRHASLSEYNVPALEESMKIHYFEEGIKDPSLEAARNAILVNRHLYTEFEAVMQLYVTSKRGQKSFEPATQGRKLSAVSGRGVTFQGRGGPGRGGRGRGDPGARQRGLVPQAEIDKVRDIEAKRYPTEVYAKFSPAQKAKHWQLMNPGMERGVGPTGAKKTNTASANVSELTAAVSSAVSAMSALTEATAKRSAADEASEELDPAGWGNPNRNNPALARQIKCPRKDDK